MATVIIDSVTADDGTVIPCNIETDGTWETHVRSYLKDVNGNVIWALVEDLNNPKHLVDTNNVNMYVEPTEETPGEIVDSKPSKPWWQWVIDTYWK